MGARRKPLAEQGYYDGQADALTFLWGDVDADDNPFAPIHRELAVEYTLWCLAQNLAVGGALTKVAAETMDKAARWYQTRRDRGYR